MKIGDTVRYTTQYLRGVLPRYYQAFRQARGVVLSIEKRGDTRQVMVEWDNGYLPIVISESHLKRCRP